MPYFAFEYWNRIDDLLKERNESLKEFSYEIGTSYDTVRGYRAKNRYPKSDVQLRIAKHLNTTVDYLIFGEDENHISHTSNLEREIEYVKENENMQKLILAIMDKPELLAHIMAILGINDD